MHFCAAKGIHLISDEIYALSVYKRGDGPSEEFTSVLAIDPTGIINPSQVHVLYGMSKVRNQSIVSESFPYSHSRNRTSAAPACDWAV